MWGFIEFDKKELMKRHWNCASIYLNIIDYFMTWWWFEISENFFIHCSVFCVKHYIDFRIFHDCYITWIILLCFSWIIQIWYAGLFWNVVSAIRFGSLLIKFKQEFEELLLFNLASFFIIQGQLFLKIRVQYISNVNSLWAQLTQIK